MFLRRFTNTLKTMPKTMPRRSSFELETCQYTTEMMLSMILMFIICTAHNINVKLNYLKLQYLFSLFKLRGGYVVVHWTFGRRDGISVYIYPISHAYKNGNKYIMDSLTLE